MWLWLAFEATTDRRTLVVDFYETSYPIYRALSTISPDFRDFDQRATLLNAIWLVALVVAIALTVFRKQSKTLKNQSLTYRETSQIIVIEGTRKKIKTSKKVFDNH